MRQDTTTFIFGALGNSQAQNAVVANIALPGGGRYRIWGMGRHSIADGLKIVAPIAMILCSGPNDTAAFGPFVVDVNAQANLTVQLNVATGASDTASCNIYAEKINH